MTDSLPSALALLACPVCWKPLVMASRSGGEPMVACSGCDRRYPIVDDIPVLIPAPAI